MNRIIYLIISVAFCSTAFAQPVDHFIQLAVDHNPGLASLKLTYQAAQEQSGQVGDYPDPMISAGLGVLPVETRLGAQRLRIGISQQLPWKGLLKARMESKSLHAETLAFVDEVKEIDIGYYIRTYYNDLVYLENSKTILNEKLEVLDVLEEISKSAVRSGKGELSNVLLVQRTRESLEADLALLDKKKEMPTIMINRWSGRALDENIELVSPSQSQYNEEDLKTFATEGHPEYQILNSKIEASKKNVELTYLEAKPKIGVGLDYIMIAGRNDVTSLAGNGRDVLMPMGNITIPLHTDRFESKRQEEIIMQDALNSMRLEKREKYLSEIATAQSKKEFAQMEIVKYENLKSITSETLELMRSEYGSDGTRFEELLKLEMELVDYEMMITKARYDEMNAQATLLKYISSEK